MPKLKISKATIESVVIQQSTRRSRLSELTKRTLGSGNLRKAVVCPEGEDVNDWLAANVLDFYNEISLLNILCVDDAKRFTINGAGYPPGMEYRWHDPLDKMSKPIRCTSPQYISYVLDWVKDCINNPEIFPVDAKDPFPSDFLSIIVKMYKRLFRVMAIMIWAHFPALEKLEAAAHANTVLKHFMFFSFEFELLDDKDTKPLHSRVEQLRIEYENAEA